MREPVGKVETGVRKGAVKALSAAPHAALGTPETEPLRPTFDGYSEFGSEGLPLGKSELRLPNIRL